jgi:small subunit ribosomal protein S1
MEENDKDLNETNEEENFADLLEQSLTTANVRLQPGQKVEATLLQKGADWAFLDVGQKGEGVLDARELLDEEGNSTVAVGDKLNVYFLSRSGGEMRFTTRLGSGAAGLAQMEEAWRSGIPVEGRLEKEVKGGYEVKLPGGVRAFCPFSQLGVRRNDAEETVVGQAKPFRISQFSEQGRNIVVSHRAILEEEQAQKREKLKETLKPGQIVHGIVTNIRDFGAFVDIGGVEGLIPISEVAYGRVEDINAVLRLGQELEVAVKSCDWEGNRFSFSLRETLADPWGKVGSIYLEGETYQGTVARLANFGAFVTLEDGIDGLIHISRLGGGRRIKDAKEVLQMGEKLAVTIEKIDLEQRRISLIPAEGEGEVEEKQTFHIEKPPQGSMGTLADLMAAKQKKKEKKKR